MEQFMMDLVSNSLFPIAGFFAMAWYVKKNTEDNREERKELNSNHKAEIDKLSSVIENNNLVLNKLCEKLDNIEERME